jgi:tetratricopeptide (TPR) repeat protein
MMTAAMISKAKFLPGFAVAFLLLTVVATGCGDDGQSPGGDAEALVNEGWALFVAGDYQSAVGKFNQAKSVDSDYRDAYDGLGWAYARLGRLEDAEAAFLFVFEILVDPSRETYTGAAVVALALKDYFRAEEYARRAIERYEDEYEFQYDHAVTHITLRLMRATARFHLGDYMSAYADVVVLDDLLELGLPNLNVTSPDFVAKLLSQIQTIRDASGGGLI